LVVVIELAIVWLPQVPASTPRYDSVAVVCDSIVTVFAGDTPASGPMRTGNVLPPFAADESYAASVSSNDTGPATPRWFRSATASVRFA
jgi:hypothetical protein